MSWVGFQETTNDFPLIEVRTNEQKLWFAVFVRAILDYFEQRYENGENKIDKIAVRKEARCFFMSTSRRTGGFIWICEMISHHPFEIVKRVREAIEKEDKTLILQKVHGRGRLQKGISLQPLFFRSHVDKVTGDDSSEPELLPNWNYFG